MDHQYKDSIYLMSNEGQVVLSNIACLPREKTTKYGVAHTYSGAQICRLGVRGRISTTQGTHTVDLPTAASPIVNYPGQRRGFGAPGQTHEGEAPVAVLACVAVVALCDKAPVLAPRPPVYTSRPAYHAPEPAYHAPEPAYHAPKPTYHTADPAYHAHAHYEPEYPDVPPKYKYNYGVADGYSGANFGHSENLIFSNSLTEVNSRLKQNEII
ncbi:uncharacterized protein LOC119599147 [Penaeus monodon]|uniref:uncharacterized protein LOC119599147 n=1 Tax=Penaeus monodon TaxID=6687 RepID=UPI0018A755F0|nr:uncharacterized protein LOC119599147 [Penaeus monodon]